MWRYNDNRQKRLTVREGLPFSPAVFTLSAFVCLLAFGNSSWGQCEIEKLTLRDGINGDLFGYSVSISGELALVGAHLYDGVGNNSGAAFVYRYDAKSKTWTQQERLEASDAQPGQFGDAFGLAVSIEGNIAIIGAPGDDEANPNDPTFGAGSAYVFRFDPKLSQWIEEDKLFASDGDIEDQFGWAASISGDVVLVGVPLDDDFGISSGSAYVFRKDPNSNQWVEEAKLTASNANEGGNFGANVAIQGDVAVIEGESNNKDLGVYAGTAYVFQYDPKTGLWNEEHKLTASDADEFDWFGSVSISDDLIVIGAAGDNDAAAGINAGAVYVFKYDAKTKLWNEADKLTASDAEPNDRFGQSVSLSNDLILVSSLWDDDACPGDPGCNSGSAYLFQFDPQSDSWIEKAKLTASDPGALDDYGRSVSISGNLAIIGSRGDDEIAPSAGAAYTYDLSACLCPADLDGDATVNTSDLLALFADWGKNPQSPADLNSDGTVNTADLLILFANWGLCG